MAARLAWVGAMVLWMPAGFAGPAAAESPVDDLQRDVACALAPDEAEVVLFWNKAWPGEILPQNLFNLDQDRVGLDTCIPSGGTVKITHLDTLVPRYPISTADRDSGYPRCINWVGDHGHWMHFGEAYALLVTYDAAAGVVMLSPDGGTTWRDCTLAATERSPQWAVLPWYSYTQTSVNGRIVVLAGA